MTPPRGRGKNLVTKGTHSWGTYKLRKCTLCFKFDSSFNRLPVANIGLS